MALQQPRPGEHLTTHAATVCQLVGKHVHRQRWHANVRFAAMDAFLRRLRVDATMGLFVSRQVRRGRVLFT